MGAYISVDFSKLPAVSAQAEALSRKMDATKDELIALQEQLREKQNYLRRVMAGNGTALFPSNG